MLQPASLPGVLQALLPEVRVPNLWLRGPGVVPGSGDAGPPDPVAADGQRQGAGPLGAGGERHHVAGTLFNALENVFEIIKND